MMHCRRLFRSSTILLAAVLTLVPSAVRAQSTISGLVTDTTGAVLPGVSVEAASPALIEKTRTGQTDAQGRYSIVDLRPGIYSVTFTLSGFTTVKRDGIEVMSNVNVPLNAELKIGTVEETITVSGQSPVVDVQAASRTEVLSRQLLETLPNSRTYGTAGSIVPGVKLTKPDIGGTSAVQQAYIVGRGFTRSEERRVGKEDRAGG